MNEDITKKLKEKIAWKDDNLIQEIVRWALVISLLLPVTFLSLFLPKELSLGLKIFLKSYIAISILIMVIWAGRRTVFISYDGILIGNIGFRERDTLERYSKRKLVNWGDIRNIEFRNRLIGAFYYGFTRPFLYIKTKERVYFCRVYDVEGFIRTLEKLKKDYLLKDKNSLYERYGIK